MSADRRASGVRHWLGFGVAGSVAFAVDAGVTWLLAEAAGLAWAAARLLGISAAIVAAFLGHRRLTFAQPGAPTWEELARYVGVAWSAAAVNYLVFVGLLWAAPRLHPTLGIGLASVVAMAVTYVGLRFAVFRR